MARRLISFLKRHPLVSYFVLTYLLAWGLWLPLQRPAMQGKSYLMPLISLGIFAPALVSIALSALLSPTPGLSQRQPVRWLSFSLFWILASAIIIAHLILNGEYEPSIALIVVSLLTGLLPAFILSEAFSSAVPGVRSLLRTYLRPKGHIGYYLLALLLFPGLWILGYFLSRALGADAPLSNYQDPDIKLPLLVILFYLYNFIYGGLSEEPGWRGFALPRLQANHSPLAASLILGLFWAIWHAPARFGGIEAKSLTDTLAEWILIVLVSVIFTWLFNRTGGSLLVTALIHPAMNTTGSFLTASPSTLLLLLAFVVFVVFLDRMWRSLPLGNPASIQTSAPST